MLVLPKSFQFLGISFFSAYDPQGNLTAGLGYTPAEQSRSLANLLLAAIDYPEDLELHLGRTILHTDPRQPAIGGCRRPAPVDAAFPI